MQPSILFPIALLAAAANALDLAELSSEWPAHSDQYTDFSAFVAAVYNSNPYYAQYKTSDFEPYYSKYTGLSSWVAEYNSIISASPSNSAAIESLLTQDVYSAWYYQWPTDSSYWSSHHASSTDASQASQTGSANEASITGTGSGSATKTGSATKSGSESGSESGSGSGSHSGSGSSSSGSSSSSAAASSTSSKAGAGSISVVGSVGVVIGAVAAALL